MLLDVLAQREPHYQASAQVWTLAERGEISAFLSAIRAGAQYLITRDPGDFPATNLAIVTPEEFLSIWSQESRSG